MMNAYMYRPTYWLVIALLIAAFVLGESAFFPSRVGAANTIPLTGWAWSAGTDTVSGASNPFMGWISFNSTNPEAGTPVGLVYGVSEDTNGNLSGYAWSSNLGWINFAPDVSSCPQNPCTAPKVNPGNGKVTGWARACSAFANKDACSGALDANSGGWDGWISLSGSNYGITESNDGTWSGYAWGSDAIGWISMNGTIATGNGMGSNDSYSVQSQRPRVVTLTADDFLIDSGASTLLRWTSFPGATSCNFLVSPPSTGGATSGNVSTGPLTSNQSYQVRCNDATGGPPVDSLPITVAVRTPIVSISANPTRVAAGTDTTLTWTASNAASCTIARNNNPTWKRLPANAPFNSSTQDTVNSQTTYTITCSGVSDSVVVNVNSVFQEF